MPVSDNLFTFPPRTKPAQLRATREPIPLDPSRQAKKARSARRPRRAPVRQHAPFISRKSLTILGPLSRRLSLGLLAAAVSLAPAQSPAKAKLSNQGNCRSLVLSGEVQAGQPYRKPFGDGLEIYLQPIHSGWILRVVSTADPHAEHDYAELATPPYNSVTPLSISTDFSFRAQDAIGWNPREFRFAPDHAAFLRLSEAYARLPPPGSSPSPSVERELAGLVSTSAHGRFRILDAKLIPGVADQWQTAAAVASHFNSTAHTIEQPSGPKADPLGRILWLKFKLELTMPVGRSALSSPVACSLP